jgi:hypothetical protein
VTFEKSPVAKAFPILCPDARGKRPRLASCEISRRSSIEAPANPWRPVGPKVGNERNRSRPFQNWSQGSLGLRLASPGLKNSVPPPERPWT